MTFHSEFQKEIFLLTLIKPKLYVQQEKARDGGVYVCVHMCLLQRHSQLCSLSLLHKQWSDSPSPCPRTFIESLLHRISHWLRLSGPVLHMSRGRWMNGLISSTPLLTVCTMVSCVLCACRPARRVNGFSSMHCWVRGLILLHPHHGLALTHPRSLFTHWLFCPLPPTTSLGRIPLLSHQGRTAVYTGQQTARHYTRCTICTDGLKAAAEYTCTWTFWKNIICSMISKSFFFKLNIFPVVPTACPPTLISIQWKPSTSLNPISLCVFMCFCVCYCGSVYWVSKCINL